MQQNISDLDLTPRCISDLLDHFKKNRKLFQFILYQARVDMVWFKCFYVVLSGAPLRAMRDKYFVKKEWCTFYAFVMA